MTHNRVWFHFEFADHSNPYIAIRTDTFWFMVQRYYLTQIGEKNFYVEGMRETNGKHPGQTYGFTTKDSSNVYRLQGDKIVKAKGVDIE